MNNFAIAVELAANNQLRFKHHAVILAPRRAPFGVVIRVGSSQEIFVPNIQNCKTFEKIEKLWWHFFHQNARLFLCNPDKITHQLWLQNCLSKNATI